ncbi:MAG: hypothetical protein QOI12_135 [Alphaproteobacteria bacterium]|nr:hypothetical protein [Alphaproteobacteria bacterium]
MMRGGNRSGPRPARRREITRRMSPALDADQGAPACRGISQRCAGRRFGFRRAPTLLAVCPRCERGMPLVKKHSEAVKVGERIGRPLDLHRSCHGLNAGVPHVSSQRTMSSCGTVASPAFTLAQRRSSSAAQPRHDNRTVFARDLGQQFGDADAALGSTCLQRVGSFFVDFDGVGLRIHGARMPRSMGIVETANGAIR